MKKKLRNSIVSFLMVACVGTQLCNFNASAGVYLSYGYPKSTSSTITQIPYLPYSASGTWNTGVSKAINNWNTNVGTTHVRFYETSQCANKILVQNSSDTWYGTTGVSRRGSSISTYTIIINKRRVSEDAVNLTNFIQSVMCHEMGHCIYLDDNPSSSVSSIMNYSRNRDMMTSPTTYDVRNVASKYN